MRGTSHAHLPQHIPHSIALPPTVFAPSTSSPSLSPTTPLRRSEGWHKALMLDLVSTLYSPGQADVGLRHKVRKWYEPEAMYESPWVTLTSRPGIADYFTIPCALSASLPWELNVYTDIWDVTESESFHGHRTGIVDHTLHITLLPFLCPPSTALSVPLSPSSPTHTPAPSSTQPATLLHLLMRLLHPLRVVSRLTTFHLRLLTRLEFNEQGRVTRHEDVVGLTQLVEGLVPGAAAAGWVGRRAVGVGVGVIGGLWAVWRGKGVLGLPEVGVRPGEKENALGLMLRDAGEVVHEEPPGGGKETQVGAGADPPNNDEVEV